MLRIYFILAYFTNIRWKELYAMNTKNKLIMLTQMSILIALAFSLLVLVRIPIIPTAPYLIYDMADVVIIISSFMFGTIPAIAMSSVLYLIEALFLTPDSWIGFIMEFTSSSIVVIMLSLFKVSEKKISIKILAIFTATIVTTIVMIPLNYVFQTEFYGIPYEVIWNVILVAVIPFNIIKVVLNCSVSLLMFKLIKPLLINIKNKI